MDKELLLAYKAAVKELTEQINRHADNIMYAYNEMTVLFWISIVVCIILIVSIINLIITIRKSSRDTKVGFLEVKYKLRKFLSN